MTISCENSRRGVAYVVLLGLLMSGVDEVSSSCDSTGLLSCLSILTRAGGETLRSGISSMPNATRLKYLCSFMKSFEDCYKPKIADCQYEDAYKLSFGTIEKTFRYMCVDGYEDMVRYNWCWVKDDVIRATTKCQETMMAGTANAARICVLITSTNKCMREAVGGKCGNGPSCVMQRAMDKAQEILAVSAKCSSPASTCRVPANGTESSFNKSSTCHSAFVLVILTTLFATFLAV